MTTYRVQQDSFMPVEKTLVMCADPECKGHDMNEEFWSDEHESIEAALILNAHGREERMEAERQIGLLNGYPVCCIEDFIADVRTGRMPGYTRSREFPALDRCHTARPDLPEYVPCRQCAAKL